MMARVRKGAAVNQIFRINIGPETLLGRLPPVRVAQTYSVLFHISGAGGSGAPAPKIWVPVGNAVLFWTGTWDDSLGLWTVIVSSDATASVRTVKYALTIGGTPTYSVGEGNFAVYDSVAGDGATGGTAGESVLELVTALEARVAELEDRSGKVPTFEDGETWVPLFATESYGIKQLTFEVPE